MVLYTVIPIEDVLNEPGAPAAQAEVAWEGRRLLVEPLQGGVGRVVRLISTDPLDYLDPRWQPGAIVPWPGSREAVIAWLGSRGTAAPAGR